MAGHVFAGLDTRRESCKVLRGYGPKGKSACLDFDAGSAGDLAVRGPKANCASSGFSYVDSDLSTATGIGRLQQGVPMGADIRKNGQPLFIVWAVKDPTQESRSDPDHQRLVEDGQKLRAGL
jgi:hypothetical protein